MWANRIGCTNKNDSVNWVFFIGTASYIERATVGEEVLCPSEFCLFDFARCFSSRVSEKFGVTTFKSFQMLLSNYAQFKNN